MAETTIEWAEDTWNMIRARVKATGAIGHFCVKVSPGCLKCYAERLQAWPIASGIRYAAQDLDKVEIFLDEEVLQYPLKRKRPRDIFPCSMTDLFADFHRDEWLARIFDVMYRTPQHRYLVLTKRAERMFNFIVGKHGAGNNVEFFRNVWFGVSAERQQEWDERAPVADEMHRLGFNTWASCEPLLGDIEPGPHQVGWAVIGLESGPQARPGSVEYVRALLQRFQAGGVPTFVKQLGAKPNLPQRLKSKKGGDPAEWPADLRVREMPT